ncbi:J domain-containing protein [Methylobacterium trifolii]|uniref:Chaperone protein DnaJ n=1 Tax=Methylobacterium trifolii TaxID=1003092 RepID=A0ABQ4U064_9HYPH|nr:DnaJ domain-containing protein [Methylobacterium trifolii]GJE60686.1 Chaperone protein DnaJ [Methylobacterium trifolii]
MDLNSRLFDSIRIKRTCDEPKPAEAAGCEAEGCTHPGLYRAPKGRRAEGQYWRFCIDHVRAYNATYNYFDGMNDAAVQAFQKDAIIGHRPTWAMGVNRPAGAKPEGETARDWAYVDPLGILRGEGAVGARGKAKRAEPERPARSATVRKALDVMGLDESADTAAIKAQYKALVKRFHPDANGGDRSFEERLRDIIRAHDVLRGAGLC